MIKFSSRIWFVLDLKRPKKLFCILIPKHLSSDLINPINDQEKTLYKNAPNTIKTAMDYPPKLALDKVS